MGGGGHANNPTFMFQVRPALAETTAARLPPQAACKADANHLLTRVPLSHLPCSFAQSDWAKNKWKGAVFVVSISALGVWVPWKAVCFAQKKAGVWS